MRDGPLQQDHRLAVGDLAAQHHLQRALERQLHHLDVFALTGDPGVTVRSEGVDHTEM